MLDDPIKQLEEWMMEQALDAMSLSTVDENNFPDSRMVLLKRFNEDGLLFFTNYESKKAQQLEYNNQAALLLFWPERERQVRIRGLVHKISYEESCDYFKTRPRGSQIGAWASKQSQILEHRQVLIKEYEKIENNFLNKDVTCPSFWGGFLLRPISFEFWQGRENRLHDRFVYEKALEGKYVVKNLYP